jgi:hypothetical protein
LVQSNCKATDGNELLFGRRAELDSGTIIDEYDHQILFGPQNDPKLRYKEARATDFLKITFLNINNSSEPYFIRPPSSTRPSTIAVHKRELPLGEAQRESHVATFTLTGIYFR